MNQWIARALGIEEGAIDWKSTFILAAMRSAAAGAIWAIICLLGGSGAEALQFLVFGVVLGLGVMIPMALLGLAGSKVFAPLGLLGFLPLAYMASGDPLLWLVERFRPGTVPVARFMPMNFKTIIIVDALNDNGMADEWHDGPIPAGGTASDASAS